MGLVGTRLAAVTQKDSASGRSLRELPFKNRFAASPVLDGCAKC